MPCRKNTTTILIVLILIAGVENARFFLRRAPSFSSALFLPSKIKGNPVVGVRVVEYTDFQCPACADGARLVKEFMQAYPGKIAVEYRHFPLDGHRNAVPIAVAAECAARQSKFWDFHDQLFRKQNLLRETINLPERLGEIAVETGLNKESFDKCVVDPLAFEAVMADKATGAARQVVATPSYFLGEKMLVGNTQLQKELEMLLGASR